jgi:hypothetical protein
MAIFHSYVCLPEGTCIGGAKNNYGDVEFPDGMLAKHISRTYTHFEDRWHDGCVA